MTQNIQDSLEPLITTTQALTALLTEETALLKDQRPQALNALVPRKSQLMANYQQEMAVVRNRGGLKAYAPGSAIRRLKQESRLFEAALTRHATRVKALKSIAENMIQAIGEEMAQQQNAANHYGADGTRAPRKTPTSIALNQKI